MAGYLVYGQVFLGHQGAQTSIVHLRMGEPKWIEAGLLWCRPRRLNQDHQA